MGDRKLTVHERMEIEMAYAVPLLRDLQEILGSDVVTDALQTRLDRQRAKAEATAAPVTSMRERAVVIGRDFERFGAGGALDFTMQDGPNDGDEPEEVAVDVTACGYATMMERLDALDLGPLLICGPDHATAAAGGMVLERSQTRMEGAGHCDFRFRAAEGRTTPEDTDQG